MIFLVLYTQKINEKNKVDQMVIRANCHSPLHKE